MKQQTGSILGTEYVKAVYCHPTSLTYMQSTSWETLGWRKHKLELQICRWYHLYGRQWRRTKEPLDESEEESEKVVLKLNIQKTKVIASSSITSWQIDSETMEMVRYFIPVWALKVKNKLLTRALVGSSVPCAPQLLPILNVSSNFRQHPRACSVPHFLMQPFLSTALVAVWSAVLSLDLCLACLPFLECKLHKAEGCILCPQTPNRDVSEQTFSKYLMGQWMNEWMNERSSCLWLLGGGHLR